MKITALVLLTVASLAVGEAAHAGNAIPLLINPDHKKNFHAAMAKIGHRYPRLNLSKRDDANGTGRVLLTDTIVDTQYYGAAKIGTPGQTILFDFDTGSSDIWFPSTQCTSVQCKKHTRFNPKKSKTFKNDSREWSMLYGDGSSAHGVLASDIVDVGGIKVRQTVGLSTMESGQFLQSPDDGIFGLGFASLESVGGVKTFMDNAVASKALAKPIFSVFLPSIRRNGGKGGNFLFGGIDESQYTGNLTYIPVTKKGYWQIDIQDVKVQGKSINKTAAGIVDTGSSLVILSRDAAAAFHMKIKGAVNSVADGGWTVPCSLAKSQDDMSFTLGGKDFFVPLADIAWSPVDESNSTCFSGVQAGNDDSLWILGDIFIKNNYCVFDYSSSPSIGMAPLKY
ncbi:hypothetical protein BGZ49_002088 [Haplosporangium sp. Z 27]|nr:hypothetical protein BGZ49_002088 [Haplosporangium sp. Z 27]